MYHSDGSSDERSKNGEDLELHSDGKAKVGRERKREVRDKLGVLRAKSTDGAWYNTSGPFTRL